MKYLGIDYGKKKIGLAVSDGLFASVYTVLSVQGLDDALTKVGQVISKEGIEEVVVGLAESGESRTMTNYFIAQLQRSVPVRIVDEHLTTQVASAKMTLLGIKKKQRKKDDAFAAAELLQTYLDSL